MKTIKINTILIALGCALTFTSMGCDKDDPVIEDKKTEATGETTLKFEHAWGVSGNTIDFALNKWLVHPMTKDSLKFDKFKYYVSNIKFKKSDGTWWLDQESYYIVDLSETNGNQLTIDNIPLGTYTELEYTLGVDSVRNESGAQTGALSPSKGMFWSWNTGYIFLKAEGESPQSPDGTFAFHLGGYKGVNNIITVKTTGFNGAPLDIAADSKPMIHIDSRPSMLWHMGKSVSDVNRLMMSNATAKTMADNCFGSFVFDHIHK